MVVICGFQTSRQFYVLEYDLYTKPLTGFKILVNTFWHYLDDKKARNHEFSLKVCFFLTN